LIKLKLNISKQLYCERLLSARARAGEILLDSIIGRKYPVRFCTIMQRDTLEPQLQSNSINPLPQSQSIWY